MIPVEQNHSSSDWSVQPLDQPPYMLGSGTQTANPNFQHKISEAIAGGRVPPDANVINLSAIRKLRSTAEHPESLWLSSGQTPSILARIVNAHISELSDALSDLREIRSEAQEENFSEPSYIATANAVRLLQEMYLISPRRFEVYPTPDGDVAIDAPSDHDRSVVLFCEAAGGALCLVNMGDKHRCARYSHACDLPDSFLRDALVELARRDEQAA